MRFLKSTIRHKFVWHQVTDQSPDSSRVSTACGFLMPASCEQKDAGDVKAIATKAVPFCPWCAKPPPDEVKLFWSPDLRVSAEARKKYADLKKKAAAQKQAKASATK
jgi:hypothetical protein